MRIHDEYRMQTVLALLQAGTVVFGSFLVGLVLKSMGYAERFDELPLLYRFIRNWGFMLILIPLAWTVATIWMERHEAWFSKRWTLVSGLALLGALAFWMVILAAKAGSTLISTMR